MSEALFGFIGVIAGGVLTGGVQLFLGWRDRKRNARVAAALIFADLALARVGLEPTVHREEPSGTPEHIAVRHLFEVWEQERRSLASGLSPGQFHVIAGAFTVVETHLAATAAGGVADKLQTLSVLEALDRAIDVAWRASGMKPSTAATDAPPSDALDGS